MTNDKNPNDPLQTKQVLLPLMGTTAPPLDKNNSVVFDLQTQPGVAGTSTCKMSVRVLDGDEDLRYKLTWARDVQTAILGLNLTTLNPSMALVKTLMSSTCHGIFITALDGLARIRFDTAMVNARQTDHTNGNTNAVDALNHAGATRHVDDVVEAVYMMIAKTLPFKTLQKVQRHLRRDCRKPAGMKVRTYANHLNRINIEEPPNIPPRDNNNALNQDELIDILLFGTPKSWQREMDRQGFDPVANTFVTSHSV